jgi:hypothetical protein
VLALAYQAKEMLAVQVAEGQVQTMVAVAVVALGLLVLQWFLQ